MNLILFNFWCLNSLNAQDLFFQHLTIENGLSYAPGNGTYGILHDSRGYIWLATNDGLCRYDGISFRVYRTNVKHARSIINNFIVALEEDADGKIWIGTIHGISVLDPVTEKYSHYLHNPEDPHSLIGNEINFIQRDLEGNMWIGTRFSGVCCFSRKLQYFIHYPPRSAGVEGKIKGGDGVCFMQRKDSSIWIGNTAGLNRYDKKNDRFECYVPYPEHTGNWRYNGIRHLMEDRNGMIWLSSATPFGRRLFDPVKASFRNFDQSILLKKQEFISAFYEDSRGNIWMGTSDGVIKWDPVSKQSVYYQHDKTKLHSILPGSVEDIFEDREGNLWFMITGMGYSILRSNNFSYEMCTPFQVFNMVEKDSGHLYLSNEKGLVLLDLDQNRIVPDNLPESIKVDRATFLTSTSRGELWIGYPWKGFTYRYNTGDVSLQKFNFINSTVEDASGNLWTHFLKRFNRETSDWDDIYLRLSKADQQLLNSKDFKSLFVDDAGHIWIGSDGQGVYRYEPEKNRLSSCKSGLPALKDYQDAIIFNLYQGSNGWLYISSSYGLGIYDPVREKLIHLDDTKGLPSRRIFSMIEDQKGYIWLTTLKGICRLDIHTLQVITYNRSNGLTLSDFTNSTAYRDRKGFLYFTSDSGLFRFDPESVGNTTSVSSVQLNRFFIDHRPIESVGPDSLFWIQVFNDRTIRLKHHQANFGFEFVMPVISDAEKVQYFYMLEGYDDTWKSSAYSREVYYTNIDPGSYTFKVKAINSAGIPCLSPYSISLVITPPWWKTWWAYSFYILVITGIIYIVFSRQRLQYRLNLETIESEKLKEVDQLKTRFFANISHEFRTPLTLILGQIDNLKMTIQEQRQLGQLDIADRNAKRLLELINQLLDLSKLEAKSMILQATEKDIVAFLKSIFFSMQLLADKKNIQLRFESTSTAIPLYFDPDKMEKIFSNLLSNAWKFTPEGGTITASVVENDTGHVVVEVSDTGIGISPENIPQLFDRFYQVDNSNTRRQQGSGIGLSLVKELVELHHGQISVRSKAGEGTTFSILLPTGKFHLTDTELMPFVEFFVGEQTDQTTWMGSLEAQGSVINLLPQEKPSGKKQVRTTVLVAEDNPDVRAFIADTLRAGGHYHVAEAANGKEGLELARSILPDLILTDVMMPEMDGITFSRLLRGDELTSHIPVIMLTAKSGEEEKMEGLQTGVDDYLTKPFNARELLLRVNNLIQIRRLLRSRFGSATVIKPSEVSGVSVDQLFLEKVLATIETNISNEQFGIEPLSVAVNMSVTHLNRKLNALIDQSAGNLIRSMRMQRAAELLEKNAGNISEIAYMVGFSVPENFSRSFKQQFNCTPLEYQRNKIGRGNSA